MNRFGLKDLILLALVLGVGVLVVLDLVQRDRAWGQTRKLEARIAEFERGLEQVRGGGGFKTPAADDSWARPGVFIQRQRPWTFVSDPRAMPGYRTGGEVCELLEERPTTIVPYLHQNLASGRVVDQVVQSLAVFDPETLRLRGVLAEAWQYDPAGLWLRVKIRTEACFSNGDPVTAEDVRWTLHEYVKRPDFGGGASSILDVIQSVEVLSPAVAEFTFAKPNYSNLAQALTMYVLPAQVYSKLSSEKLAAATGILVGSGPFKLESTDPPWVPGQDIVLVRNDRYWSDRPALDKLRFRVVTDPTARLTAYTNGEGQVFMPTPAQLLEAAPDPNRSQDTRLLNWTNVRSPYLGIAWQCGDRAGKPSVFKDKSVRRAMTHLIDRTLMNREIYRGIGTVISQPCNPESVQYDATLEPWPCSTEKAAALLAEAGWKRRAENGPLVNGAGEEFRFAIMLPEMGDIDDQIARYLADRCAAVGIVCTADVVDRTAHAAKARAHDFDAVLWAWFPRDPETDLSEIFHSRAIAGGNNFNQWSSPEADTLLDKARQTLDPAQRADIWRQFLRVTHEEQPYTWIRTSPWLRFVSRRIENVTPYRTGLNPAEWFLAPPPAPPPG